MPSSSFPTHSDDSSIGPPYNLDSLDVIKRPSASTYEDLRQGTPLAAIQAAENKKARFVSDGNINLNAINNPNNSISHLASSTYSGIPGSAPANAHHGFSASLGSLAQQQQHLTNNGVYPQSANAASAQRSFSSNLATSGFATGMPAPSYAAPPDPNARPQNATSGLSPYLANAQVPQYATVNSASSSPLNQHLGQQQQPPQSLLNSANAMLASGTVGFATPGPFLIGGANGLGVAASAGVYGSFGNPAALGFGMSPGLSPGIGSFMPNVGMLAGQLNQTGRTVYVGALPADASVDELLNLVKFGPIESVKLLPEKSCAFIAFLDGPTAAAFHADANVKKISLHSQELKIGWGKPSPCPPAVMMAVQQNQATRNVYLGNLEEDVTEQSLRDDLARFGPIDQVKIVRDKNIGFVHFLSISTAIKVVSQLPSEPTWSAKKINFGKDRCAYIPKSQQQNQLHNNQAAAMGMAAAASLGYPTAFSPTSSNGYSPFMSPMSGVMGLGMPPGSSASTDQRSPSGSMFTPSSAGSNVNMAQLGNRTVYLGNIHPDTSIEEICNHIRGGILQSVRLISEKHIAFVTFVDPNAALAFFHLATYSGVMIHNRRLKIGWGKHSGPLQPAIAVAVSSGGSRNVYVGNIDDSDFLNEQKLRSDFGEYGEIELVNSLADKNCAFINFCNIQNAIKAIEAMKNHSDYQTVKISYGKDRCGNPPRSVSSSGGPGSGGGPNRKSSGTTVERSLPADGDEDTSAHAQPRAPAPSGKVGLAPLEIKPNPMATDAVAVEGDDFEP